MSFDLDATSSRLSILWQTLPDFDLKCKNAAGSVTISRNWNRTERNGTRHYSTERGDFRIWAQFIRSLTASPYTFVLCVYDFNPLYALDPRYIARSRSRCTIYVDMDIHIRIDIALTCETERWPARDLQVSILAHCREWCIL